MNEISSKDFTKKPTKASTIETPESLEMRVMQARSLGQEYVETSPEMLKFLTGTECDCMDYKNVKLFVYGKKEELCKKFNMQMEEANFGHSQVTIATVDKNERTGY